MRDMENLKHAQTRGKLLRLLAEDYASNMTSVGTLVSALDLSGFTVSESTMNFHLTYLADSNYLRLWRTQDMAGYRRDRLTGGARPDDIRFAKVTPKGIQLIDADIPEDPKVKF